MRPKKKQVALEDTGRSKRDGGKGLTPTDVLLLSAPVDEIVNTIRPRHISAEVWSAFAELPESEWPAPSAVDLARVAAALPHGRDAERASHAVALTWECALAQRAAAESVRKWGAWCDSEKKRIAEFSRVLKMKREDFPLTHPNFLAKLDTRPLQVQAKPLKAQREPKLRGHALWLKFLSDRSHIMGFPCTQTQAEEEDARYLRNGWEAHIAFNYAKEFALWRARIISTRKREAGRAGKNALEGARFTTRKKVKKTA